MALKLDPGTSIFIKGIDITDLVKSAVVKTQTQFVKPASFADITIPVNEDISITLELDLKGSNIQAYEPADGDSELKIYIGELPADEFFAEMVRLKLRRVGILK